MAYVPWQITLYSSDGSTTLYSAEHKSTDMVEVTTTGVAINGKAVYTYAGNGTYLGWSNTVNSSTATFPIGYTDYVDSAGFSGLYLVEQSATPTISFKHRFKNDTLIGTGTYKFRRYSVQEPTPLPQLSAPTNVSVSGTKVSFNSVENATSYDILVDGTSIGTYTP